MLTIMDGDDDTDDDSSLNISWRQTPLFGKTNGGNVYVKKFNVNCRSIRNRGCFKDGAHYFKGIFFPVYEYAGIANLYKCYWNPKENWE